MTVGEWDRLVDLAFRMAHRYHDRFFEYEPDEMHPAGELPHTSPIETCQHPDCVLIRNAKEISLV